MVIMRQIALMLAVIVNLYHVRRLVVAFHNTAFSNKSKSHAFLKRLHASSTKRNNNVDNTIEPKHKIDTRETMNDETSQQQTQSYNDNNKSDDKVIEITIKRYIPFVKPIDVKKAWMTYTWEQGGALPIIELLSSSKQKRLLLPSFFEEELLESTYNNDSVEIQTQQYKISKWGILHWDAIPNSHLGTIQCIESNNNTNKNNNGTDFIWNVSYRVKNNYNFWNYITNSFITQAADNLVSYLASKPMSYTCKTLLSSGNPSPSDSDSDLCINDVMNQWIQFIWKDGGGLPLPFPPIMLSSSSSSSSSSSNNNNNETLLSRYMLPIFLKESILSIDYDNNTITYTVDNPSALTLYPVYEHLGTVSFVYNKNNGIDMIWNVTVLPYPNIIYKRYVTLFTSSVITTLSTNFQCNIKYYHSDNNNNKANIDIPTIPLRLPKKMNQDIVLLNIRKDSWIGHVLDVHLNDERSSFEQASSLFQPWTWGKYNTSEDANSLKEYWTLL